MFAKIMLFSALQMEVHAIRYSNPHRIRMHIMCYILTANHRIDQMNCAIDAIEWSAKLNTITKYKNVAMPLVSSDYEIVESNVD